MINTIPDLLWAEVDLHETVLVFAKLLRAGRFKGIL